MGIIMKEFRKSRILITGPSLFCFCDEATYKSHFRSISNLVLCFYQKELQGAADGLVTKELSLWKKKRFHSKYKFALTPGPRIRQIPAETIRQRPSQRGWTAALRKEPSFLIKERGRDINRLPGWSNHALSDWIVNIELTFQVDLLVFVQNICFHQALFFLFIFF